MKKYFFLMFFPLVAFAQIRIMPLGDSITFGECSESTGGYRQFLLYDLKDLNIVFVGTQTDTISSHEGHPGWTTIDFLEPWYHDPNYTYLNHYLDINNPDIVLLHIGTNDISNDSDASVIYSRLQKMLTIIHNFNPAIRIILAEITKRFDLNDYPNPTAEEMAKYIETGTYDSLIQNSGESYIVDMYDSVSHFCTDNIGLYPSAHPSTEGYQQMANVWYTAITNIYPNTPNSPTNLTASIISTTQIILNWKDNSDNEDGFRIERKVPPSVEWVQIDSVSPNDTSYNNTELTPNTEYCYRIIAYNKGGNSLYSNEVCVTTNPESVISITVPNGGEIWTLNSSQNIEWISENVASVKIEISRNNGTTWSTIDSSYESTDIYPWIVHGNISMYCKIKITDVSNPEVWDTSASVFSITSPTGVEEELLTQIPTEYRLYQNYPNTFNPSTKINYSIPKRSNVTIKVFDMLGKEVTTLVNEEKTTGNYEVEFNGSKLPSGVYFYRLEAGFFVETKKMVLMK